MTDPNSKKNEMLVMWIGSAAIVLLLLAAMGIVASGKRLEFGVARSPVT